MYVCMLWLPPFEKMLVGLWWKTQVKKGNLLRNLLLYNGLLNEVFNKRFLQVNCVVMKGLNDDEICDFVSLTQNKVRYFSVFRLQLIYFDCKKIIMFQITDFHHSLISLEITSGFHLPISSTNCSFPFEESIFTTVKSSNKFWKSRVRNVLTSSYIAGHLGLGRVGAQVTK